MQETINRIAYKYVSHMNGAGDIWDTAIEQTEAALRYLLGEILLMCNSRAHQHKRADSMHAESEARAIADLLLKFDEESPERPRRREIRFKDGSRYNWLFVVWQSGETASGDCTWAYTVDREDGGEMAEVYHGEITGQGDESPKPRELMLDYFMYIAGAMFEGAHGWQVTFEERSEA